MTFTRDAVAITLQPYYSDGQYVDAPHFVAHRTDYEFRQVSEEELAKLTGQEHIQEETKPHKRRNYQVTHSKDCTDIGYRYDTGPQDLDGRRTIQIESDFFEVRMLCRSTIATALLLDSDLWIATYEEGGHGEYGAEGVLVVAKNGASISRLDVGPYPIEDIVADPWSPDVWIVTRSQLTRITKEKEIISRYWKYRDFDASSNRPAVFVTASKSEIKNNPLAVLADWLGEPSFAGLSQAHRNGVVLPRREPLYYFVMFGNYYSHHGQWPEDLASTLDAAEPTFGWRRFACIVAGERAKELCELELEDWPTAEE